MSKAFAVTCSDHPCGATSRRRERSNNRRINAFPYGTLNPDSGVIREKTGRREGHEKNGKMNSQTGSQSVASVLMVNRWAMRPTKVL
jgi:hypothetical protein